MKGQRRRDWLDVRSGHGYRLGQGVSLVYRPVPVERPAAERDFASAAKVTDGERQRIERPSRDVGMRVEWQDWCHVTDLSSIWSPCLKRGGTLVPNMDGAAPIAGC